MWTSPDRVVKYRAGQDLITMQQEDRRHQGNSSSTGSKDAAVPASPSTRSLARVETITAMQASVIHCAEALGRAFEYLREAQSCTTNKNTPINLAASHLVEALQALAPIHRLIDQDPRRISAISNCIKETTLQLEAVLNSCRSLPFEDEGADKNNAITELAFRCPHISHLLENTLSEPLRKTKQELS